MPTPAKYGIGIGPDNDLIGQGCIRHDVFVSDIVPHVICIHSVAAGLQLSLQCFSRPACGYRCTDFKSEEKLTFLEETCLAFHFSKDVSPPEAAEPAGFSCEKHAAAVGKGQSRNFRFRLFVSFLGKKCENSTTVQTLRKKSSDPS